MLRRNWWEVVTLIVGNPAVVLRAPEAEGATLVVNAVWSASHALHLWLAHSDDPWAPLTPDAAGSAPLRELAERFPALARVFASPPRGRVDLVVPHESGWARRTVAGTHALFPSRAWPVLKELATSAAMSSPDAATHLTPSAEGSLAASPPLASRPPRPAVALCPALAFLVHVAAAVAVWVDAGRVVPRLVLGVDEGYGRWDLVRDAETTAWLAAAAAAMPSQLRAEVGEPSAPNTRSEHGAPRGVAARTLLADIVAELVDSRVASRLEGRGPSTTPPRTAMLAWLASLENREPLAPVPAGDLRRTAELVDAWAMSSLADPYELLLRLDEAHPDVSSNRENEEGPASGAHLGDWVLRPLLRSTQDPAEVVSVEGASRAGSGVDPTKLLVAGLGQAGAVWPPLVDWVARTGGGDIGLSGAEVLSFATEGAPALLAAGIAVEVPARWLKATLSLSVTVTGREEVGATASGVLGLDQVADFGWQAALGDTPLTRDELEALAAAKSPLVRLRGQWVEVDAVALARTQRFLAAGHQSGTLRELIDRYSGRREMPVELAEVRATGWLEQLFARPETLDGFTPPPGLRAELRPYQSRGVAWLAAMAQRGIGVILADDMGLGKTVQLLALIEAERDAGLLRGPTLIVCPMSVVGNWQREAARFTPGLTAMVHHGAGRAHGAELAAQAERHDLVLTTYATAARDIDTLVQVAWHRVALDEAQHVKNPATRQAKAMRRLQARHRVALTGTPVENRLDELRALLDFVNPGMLGSAQGFRTRFALPIERHHDIEASRRLRAVTAPFLMRRLKTDPAVITDLPEKLEFNALANLTAEQAGLYQAVVDELMGEVGRTSGLARHGMVLAALTKLKQICNHPAHFLGDGSALLRRGVHRSGKLALLDDLIESIYSDDERVLLFTQYREFGLLLAPYLEERFGLPVPFLHGGVAAGERDRMVAAFQAGTGPGALALSLRAGGTGLNLTAASQVIHVDRWWNPAVEDQATDRAFRIGQTRRVQVRKLVCVGTLEERIDTMIASKRALADEIVGGSESWIGELSDAELADLVELSSDAVGE